MCNDVHGWKKKKKKKQLVHLITISTFIFIYCRTWGGGFKKMQHDLSSVMLKMCCSFKYGIK